MLRKSRRGSSSEYGSPKKKCNFSSVSDIRSKAIASNGCVSFGQLGYRYYPRNSAFGRTWQDASRMFIREYWNLGDASPILAIDRNYCSIFLWQFYTVRLKAKFSRFGIERDGECRSIWYSIRCVDVILKQPPKGAEAKSLEIDFNTI